MCVQNLGLIHLTLCIRETPKRVHLASKLHLTLCIRETPKRVLLQCSEDQDEMQHNAAFHQGLHCL